MSQRGWATTGKLFFGHGEIFYIIRNGVRLAGPAEIEEMKRMHPISPHVEGAQARSGDSISTQDRAWLCISDTTVRRSKCICPQEGDARFGHAFRVTHPRTENAMPPHRTALVVDADPNTIDSVRELLPWQQVRVDSTGDAHAAIECLEKGSYCGLILDLALANGDGLDVLRHMSEQRINIPIVVVASKFPDAIRELPIAPAIKSVLARPIDPSLLASIILGLCGMESRSVR